MSLKSWNCMFSLVIITVIKRKETVEEIKRLYYSRKLPEEKKQHLWVSGKKITTKMKKKKTTNKWNKTKINYKFYVLCLATRIKTVWCDIHIEWQKKRSNIYRNSNSKRPVVSVDSVPPLWENPLLFFYFFLLFFFFSIPFQVLSVFDFPTVWFHFTNYSGKNGEKQMSFPWEGRYPCFVLFSWMISENYA